MLQLANQASYRKLVDGVPYTVFEWRYAFFPSEAGTLTIPPQGFQGQLYLDQRLRQVSGKTHPLTVKVNPVPAQWPKNTPWLPARWVKISARWIEADKPLKAGETVTLELTIDASGQRAALIPDLPHPQVDGVRLYAEPPQLDNDLRNDGVYGRKVIRWTMLFEKPGTITVPELTLYWWDVTQGKVRQARVAARTFQVAPAPGQATLKPVTPQEPTPAKPTPSVAPSALLPWQMATAAFFTLMLLFMGLWWRQKRYAKTHSEEFGGDVNSPPANTSKKAFNDLCQLPPDAFYRALLSQREQWQKDEMFREALHALERALLVDMDTNAAQTAKEHLCEQLKLQASVASSASPSSLKNLYPR